jgi:hypothetical protein
MNPLQILSMVQQAIEIVPWRRWVLRVVVGSAATLAVAAMLFTLFAEDDSLAQIGAASTVLVAVGLAGWFRIVPDALCVNADVNVVRVGAAVLIRSMLAVVPLAPIGSIVFILVVLARGGSFAYPETRQGVWLSALWFPSIWMVAVGTCWAWHRDLRPAPSGALVSRGEMSPQ